MRKMFLMIAMALGLVFAFGADAQALNSEKLQKLQTKLDKLEYKTLSQGPTISNPEPSTILLLGSGIAAFGIWRWRKRQ